MYKLALKKVEKDIQPYFRINIKSGKLGSVSENNLYSKSLNELKEVLIEIKRKFDKEKLKIESEKTNKYYEPFSREKKQILLIDVLKSQCMQLDFIIKSSRKKKTIKKKLTDEDLLEYIEEENEKNQKYIKNI